jgi:hypothetical protein
VDKEIPDNIPRMSEVNTWFQDFEIFVGLLILNYKMYRKLVQMVEGLIDLLTTSLLCWRRWKPTPDSRIRTFTLFARRDLNFIV